MRVKVTLSSEIDIDVPKQGDLYAQDVVAKLWEGAGPQYFLKRGENFTLINVEAAPKSELVMEAEHLSKTLRGGTDG